MYEDFKYDVFLSHSSKDVLIVSELAERLINDGLRVWFPDWEIQPGDARDLKLEWGLEQSRTLVLIMSANAFASEWGTLERHTARFRDPTNSQRRFIPLRLDDTGINDTLKQSLTLTGDNDLKRNIRGYWLLVARLPFRDKRLPAITERRNA